MTDSDHAVRKVLRKASLQAITIATCWELMASTQKHKIRWLLARTYTPLRFSTPVTKTNAGKILQSATKVTWQNQRAKTPLEHALAFYGGDTAFCKNSLRERNAKEQLAYIFTYSTASTQDLSPNDLGEFSIACGKYYSKPFVTLLEKLCLEGTKLEVYRETASVIRHLDPYEKTFAIGLAGALYGVLRFDTPEDNGFLEERKTLPIPYFGYYRRYAEQLQISNKSFSQSLMWTSLLLGCAEYDPHDIEVSTGLCSRPLIVSTFDTFEISSFNVLFSNWYNERNGKT